MRWRLLAVVLVAGSLAPPAADAAPACPNATTSGRWTAVTLPAGSASWPVVVVPAAKSGQRDVLVAATERALHRSADGGCTWQKAFDLDTDAPADSRARHNVSVRWHDVAVSGVRGAARTLYALGADATGTATASMPVTVATSTDGGAHWKLHEPPAGPALAAQPRCTFDSTLVAGPDPAVAHLSCVMTSIVESIATAASFCRRAVYVTTDTGATWREVTSRMGDPARIAPDNLSGCGPMGTDANALLTGDPALPRGLWRLGACTNTVHRSSDSGATLAVYGTLPGEQNCHAGFFVVPLPRGGQAVVVCDLRRAFVTTKAGTFASTAPNLRAQERGTIAGCTWDARNARVVVFYADGTRKQRLMTFDPARRSWRTLTYVPPVKGNAGWSEFTPVEGEVSAVTRTLYVREAGQGERLFRTVL